jgi:hypothetical protein
VRRTRDKLAFRRLLVGQGFLCPKFRHLPSGRDPRQLGDQRFPCVVKARRLSASRGVIRANDPDELLRAVNWVRAIQASADRDAEDLGIVIEDFIRDGEYALEGRCRTASSSRLRSSTSPIRSMARTSRKPSTSRLRGSRRLSSSGSTTWWRGRAGSPG